jgi:hypothetical protein
VSFSEGEIAYLRSQRLARIAAAYMRITPTISWSFNLDGLSFTHDREVNVRRTVHQAAAGSGG